MSGKGRGRERGAEEDAGRELIFIFAWRHGRLDERRNE